MKTLQLSDEQYQLMVFALLIYAQECEKTAQTLHQRERDQASDGQLYQINRSRAQQCRELSTLMNIKEKA